MLKFILGVIAGALLSFGYVRYNVELPGLVQLPDRLRGNLVSAATESELFDLDAPPDVGRRALEVYFANRPQDAAALDAAAGHPFLAALHRDRAQRQARQVSLAWTAFDEGLSKPALRAALERKHATTETAALKQAMLEEALGRKPFLKSWLEKNRLPTRGEALRQALRTVASQPPQARAP
jgi:hypothetical protein